VNILATVRELCEKGNLRSAYVAIALMWLAPDPRIERLSGQIESPKANRAPDRIVRQPGFAERRTVLTGYKCHHFG
jgi:hypothetical protein